MQKVLTAEQMREVDRLTTEKYGIPSILLMENAAHAVARVITEKLGGSVKGKSIFRSMRQRQQRRRRRGFGEDSMERWSRRVPLYW